MLSQKFYLISRASLHLAAAALLAGVTVSGADGRLVTLQSVAGLPPHVVGRFGEPAGFQQDAEGQYFVVDRRGHTVYRIDATMAAVTPLVAIGRESGRILLPFGFDLGQGEFAVADAPDPAERVQVFTTNGSRVSAFTLARRSEARVQLNGLVLNGAGSMRFTVERTVLLNQPDTGALISEYDVRGRALRGIGTLRATSQDDDEQLRLAFNAGLPVPVPGGGFYFVFQTGEPRFRRYDATGVLMFERVIQGRELDALVQSQPTIWPRRPGYAAREIPVVRPIVRTAAVDGQGQLWISFVVPVTYVYDRDGEKARTVQFRAAGLIAPASLYFTDDGRLLVTPGCYVFRP